MCGEVEYEPRSAYAAVGLHEQLKKTHASASV